MHVAAKVGFLPWVRDAEAFDLEAYQHYEQVQHGDLNWVLPGKLLAFAGPTAVSKVIPRPPSPPSPLFLVLSLVPPPLACAWRCSIHLQLCRGAVYC